MLKIWKKKSWNWNGQEKIKIDHILKNCNNVRFLGQIATQILLDFSRVKIKKKKHWNGQEKTEIYHILKNNVRFLRPNRDPNFIRFFAC